MEFKCILKDFLTENGLTVSAWLAGKAKPGYDTLRKMALAFNISADYFLGITEEY